MSEDNILNWIDDKGYKEQSLDSPEVLASFETWRERIIGLNPMFEMPYLKTPIYAKMSDGCCHKTVVEYCADCPFKEK